MYIPQDKQPEHFIFPNYDNELEKILNMIAFKGASYVMPKVDEKPNKFNF
jgi:hypothetical protein